MLCQFLVSVCPEEYSHISIALRQDSLVRDEMVERPIVPRDIMKLEISIRTRTDDDLPESIRGEYKRDIGASERLANCGHDLRVPCKILLQVVGIERALNGISQAHLLVSPWHIV